MALHHIPMHNDVKKNNISLSYTLKCHVRVCDAIKFKDTDNQAKCSKVTMITDVPSTLSYSFSHLPLLSEDTHLPVSSNRIIAILLFFSLINSFVFFPLCSFLFNMFLP